VSIHSNNLETVDAVKTRENGFHLLQQYQCVTTETVKVASVNCSAGAACCIDIRYTVKPLILAFESI